jgi:putative redox protein
MVTAHRKNNLKDTLAVEILSGSHKILSDVSVKLGGNDEAPDPHRLLEAALSACTIMTLQMYASAKKIELNDVEVMVRIDSEGSETHLTREIHFTGDQSDEQKSRFVEIANKCPIHRLLCSHVTIETKLT